MLYLYATAILAAIIDYSVLYATAILFDISELFGTPGDIDVRSLLI